MTNKIRKVVIASEAMQSVIPAKTGIRKLLNLRVHSNGEKLLVCIFVLVFGFMVPVFAENASVQIQKTEDRTGAALTPAAPRKTSSGNNAVDRFFSLVETGIMGVAEPVSDWAGKGADAVTLGVEKTGSFIFARGFRAIDLKNKFKQT